MIYVNIVTANCFGIHIQVGLAEQITISGKNILHQQILKVNDWSTNQTAPTNPEQEQQQKKLLLNSLFSINPI